MKQIFSTMWKSSIQPRKQRKYVANAPLHIKRKFLSVHLSKELRKKYKTRAVKIRKGDKVKILRGQFNGNSGAIVNVLTKKSKVNINSAQIVKMDGSKVYYPIHCSNLIITELNVDDKLRRRSLENVTSQKNKVK